MSKQKIKISVSVQCEGVSHVQESQETYLTLDEPVTLQSMQSWVIENLRSGNWLKEPDSLNGRDAKIQALAVENLQESKIQVYLNNYSETGQRGCTARTQNLFALPSLLNVHRKPEVDVRNDQIQSFIDAKRKAEQAGKSYELLLSVYIPKQALDLEVELDSEACVNAGEPEVELDLTVCVNNEPEASQGPGPVSVTLVTVGAVSTVGLLLGLGAWAMKDGAATLGAGLHSLFTSSVVSTVGGASTLAVLSGVILTLLVVAGVMMLAKHGPKKQASVADHSVTNSTSSTSQSTQASVSGPLEKK